MADRLVDAAAHTRAVSADLSPEPRDFPSAGEMRARAQRYRLLSETLVNPVVIELVQACVRELEAHAAAIETAEVI